MTQIFNINGYFKDYYFNGKFIGNIRLETKDRENYGYIGRRSEILESDTIVNKKKLKIGSEVLTEIYPICGSKIKQL